MKNKYLKILLLISLALIMALSLISCGSPAANANDANDQWGDITWDYKKDTKTLTITGAGKMPDAISSDKVGWASVRESVENVVLSETITSIGDYAFYGMSNLKAISIPSGITSIGKCSFAFCVSLENISIPSSVTSLGESAFEACVTLKSITLPEAVTSLGERAFAYCRELTSATIAGNVEKIDAAIFTDCAKLSTLTVRNGLKDFNEAPFKKAGIKVEYIEGLSDVTTVITYYKDADGKEIRDKKEETKKYGESYSTVAPTIEGYNIKGEKSYTGKVNGEKVIEKVFVYEKIVETEAPEVPEESDVADKTEEKNEGFTVEHVIGIVVLVVVLAGICVGAVLLARSNKKQQKGSTVRKNQNKKK